MKISEALNKQKGRFEIPDCGRDDFPEFFKEQGFKVGAEIGVRAGEFSEVIGKSGLKLYCIDPWQIYDDFADIKDQNRMEELYEETRKKLAPYDCTIIRKTSMEAVKDFADNSLDFAYIDANHSFKFVTEDIFEWSKKIRKGGVIAGHDYGIPVHKKNPVHTRYVVDAYTKAFEIKYWYVLGRKERLEGEQKDIWRSWFWVK